ncbi:hypothetical protein [Saccharopolyspora antimicrobica]|uniref:hypothetical protein n=1 Tax=Saccharopolyspora antimicrobica TaxID=455193 RepID=UPI001160896D|nr:hypothetical protein [Saccharopolyspora antimicrobica]
MFVLVLVLGFGFGLGLVLGLNGLVDGLGLGLISGLTFGLVVGLVVVPVVGFVVGLANGIVSALGDTYNPHATAPWTLLSLDRKVTLIRMAIATTFIAAVLAFMITAEIEATLLYLTLGLVAGIVRLVFSAWGSWLLFVRLWLPLTRRLPWQPKLFIEDAHERGVLRTAGSAYQFRHARLRDHLAHQHRN